MKLLTSEIRCLIRTDIAMREWMGHRISDKEAAAYATGRETSETTWKRMKQAGLVRNVSGLPGVMITEDGRKELRKLGL
jgi:hypothetical protein